MTEQMEYKLVFANEIAAHSAGCHQVYMQTSECQFHLEEHYHFCLFPHV